MTDDRIRTPVDSTNPGQFFACCGLFELADRLWRGPEAWFADGSFLLRSEHGGGNSLAELLRTFKEAQTAAPSDAGVAGDPDSDNRDDDKAEPMELGAPFALRLDWWADKSLKSWAGSMNARRIFTAMTQAIDEMSDAPFDDCRVVYENAAPATGRSGKRRQGKLTKCEPFYFDARRGACAKAIDTGFMPNKIDMTTAACPAVEALCLVGLQRFRPLPTDRPRVFDYWTWSTPLPTTLAAVAACGLLPGAAGARYRFENAFRTDQRKHKGFMPAAQIGGSP